MAKKLPLAQNAAASLLTVVSKECITPALAHLHWLPVHIWAQFKVLVMTFETLFCDLGPEYLKNLPLPI